jgi:hypothetical protein
MGVFGELCFLVPVKWKKMTEKKKKKVAMMVSLVLEK